MDKSGRDHKWCTPVDHFTWTRKDRTNSSNRLIAALCRYGMQFWRPTGREEWRERGTEICVLMAQHWCWWWWLLFYRRIYRFWYVVRTTETWVKITWRSYSMSFPITHAWIYIYIYIYIYIIVLYKEEKKKINSLRIIINLFH